MRGGSTGPPGAAGQSLSCQQAASVSTPGEWGVGEGEERVRQEALVPHETVGRGCGTGIKATASKGEGKKEKEKCPGTSHMKLAVIALRAIIVPVLQRELASVWRHNWSGVPATYSGYFGLELSLNHKNSNQKLKS